MWFSMIHKMFLYYSCYVKTALWQTQAWIKYMQSLHVAICNSNWTKSGTIQGVIVQLISKQDKCTVTGWFETASMITPWIVQHQVHLLINHINNKFMVLSHVQLPYEQASLISFATAPPFLYFGYDTSHCPDPSFSPCLTFLWGLLAFSLKWRAAIWSLKG